MRIRPTNPTALFVAIGLAVTALFFVALEAFGTDINKGYAFTPTDRVTNTKLNNLVDLAAMNADFIHLLTAVAPVSSDEVIIYQPSSGLFRKVTVGTFSLNNTNLIMGQTEDTAPATNDFFLTYDASAGTFKRVSLFNALPLSGFQEMTNPPDIGFKLYITSNGIPYWTSMTNLHQQIYRHYQLANPSNSVSDPTNYYLSARGQPVKTDALLLWAGNTNKYTTLSNLVVLSAAATLATNGDFFWGYSTNDGQIVKFTMLQIQKSITNSPTLAITNKLPQTFITNGIALGNGLLVNGAHGLGGIPQCVRWVLVQTNSAADNGWGQNREVSIESVFDSATGKAWFTAEADSTTIILTAASTGTLQIRNASTGAAATLDTAKWVAKGYITYFPTFP